MFSNKLNISKATPAFKRKDQFGTSHTLTSNEGRISVTSTCMDKRQQFASYIESLKKEHNALETSEGCIGRRTMDLRQLVKKTPQSLVSNAKIKQAVIKMKRTSEGVVKQDEKEQNVYHIFGKNHF